MLVTSGNVHELIKVCFFPDKANVSWFRKKTQTKRSSQRIASKPAHLAVFNKEVACLHKMTRNKRYFLHRPTYLNPSFGYVRRRRALIMEFGDVIVNKGEVIQSYSYYFLFTLFSAHYGLFGHFVSSRIEYTHGRQSRLFNQDQQTIGYNGFIKEIQCHYSLVLPSSSLTKRVRTITISYGGFKSA